MYRIGLVLAYLVSLNFANSQEMTASQLLEKSIEFHDPNSNWAKFQGTLFITMTTPDANQRVSEISLDLPKSLFKAVSTKNDNTIEQVIVKDSCSILLNGSNDYSEDEAKTHRLSCERASMMKDYYTYLYGLPMKLKDPGTHIDSTVQTKTFKGKKYLVLKVTYDQNVGDDIWYFYFDPETYAMEVYQFFHDESKNDGEYILLSELEDASGIKMPKIRAWYYNKDDKYLGTDELTKSSGL